MKGRYCRSDSTGHCDNTVHMNRSLILDDYKRKVDAPDELLDRILDAVACLKKRKDRLRRTTRDLRTRVAKCTEVDGGIFEHLL
jgi:MoxR-like ATPase